MSKNEIHARISLHLMETLRRICSEKSSNLSDVTRAAFVLYVDAYEFPHLFEHHKLLKSQNSLEIGLIGTSLETTRATPDLLDEPPINLGFKVVNNDIELPKKNDSVIQIIEQELGVFFARCRDEHDPEDGQLYWFWFEDKDGSLRRFDADSPDNWCPIKRFKSQEDAIKDCLKQKSNQLDIDSPTKSFLPSLDLPDEFNEDNVIDW